MRAVSVDLLRAVAWVALVCVFAACASVRPVDPGAPFEKTEVDDKLVLHLKSGETLTTNRMTVTDSTFVLHTLVADGKQRTIDPMTVRRDDVASIQRIKPRWPVIIGVASLVTVGLILLMDEFGGWSEGT